MSDSPPAATQAMAVLYGEDIDFKTRFGDVSGSVLLDQIFNTYQVESDLVSVPWFGANGTPNIPRHALDMRKQDSVVERYVESILQRGVVSGVRSEAWMVYSPGRTFPALALSFGTLAEAFNKAVERAPNNSFAMNTLQKALTGVRMFHEKTPSNVLSFLKSYSNEFHNGSSWTIFEMLDEVLDLEMQWSAHRTSKSISAKIPNYEGLYWEFVKDRCHGRIKSWKQYDSAK